MQITLLSKYYAHSIYKITIFYYYSSNKIIILIKSSYLKFYLKQFNFKTGLKLNITCLARNLLYHHQSSTFTKTV